MTPSDRPTIAVCSWSLQPKSVDDLIAQLRACGLQAVQLAIGPLLETPQKWAQAGQKLRDAGIELVSGMMGCVGEDYSSIATIKETGGVLPDATYPATLHNMRRAAPLAADLGIKLVTFHAGFIPHAPDSPDLKKGIARVAEIARAFADSGIAVALETGQEPAEALLRFLELSQPLTVGVNFDPANMLLYGSGDPIAAVDRLLPHVQQVHIKDALPSGTSGEWGREVPVGTGAVDWKQFFQLLRAKPLSYVIEREAGTSRTADIIKARDLVLRYASPEQVEQRA